MTTFEITTIALLAVIMLMVIILVKTAIGGFHDVWQQLNANWEQLRKIETHEDISTSVIIELMDIVDKMHRNLCVEIADKMVDRVYPPTYNPPCYAPNGICTNPQMDCINCPKRGTGGIWSTSTNLNKEN